MDTETHDQGNNNNQGSQGMQIRAIRALASEIPLNDFGLPTGIYRTDLLPYHDYKPHNPHNTPKALPMLAVDAIDHTDVLNEVDLTSLTTPDVYRIAGFPAQSLHGAFMPLQFDEGYPAFENGQPFWTRLEYEPSDAYEAFQRYLQMSLGKPGTQPEYDDEDGEYDGTEASGMRSISALATDMFPNQRLLQMTQVFQEYYHLYYWGMRAHAYDLYRIAQHRTQQELRMVETQDEHYMASRRLRHRLMQYMNNEEEFWDMMTPKTGIDMFKTITSLERISAGMPAGGPINEAAEANRGKPFEVTMRTVAQTNRRIGDSSKIISEEGEVLDRALEDPNATEVLQELIIRTGGF